MNEINLELLTEIEELQAVLELYEEAKEYIESFKWCVEVKGSWYQKELGIYNKVGVFLFEIEPINENVDDFIWVIAGDLPYVYLDKYITTGREALERYCELMEEWAANVKAGQSLDECYPVEDEPTIENADMLISRIAFIKRELLMKEE